MGYVLEHIIVAEKKLGRMLRPGETVHHIDRNRKNNDPDNLMVFATVGDHTAFHAGHEIFKDGDVWRAIMETSICPVCGKEFVITSQQKKYKTRYCGIGCKLKSDMKVQDIQTILDLILKENGNFVKAAQILNVTDSALHHRLKRAGLPYHSMDYRRK